MFEKQEAIIPLQKIIICLKGFYFGNKNLKKYLKKKSNF